MGGWQTNYFPIRMSEFETDTFTTYSCTCHILYLHCMQYSNQQNKEVRDWIVMCCQKFWVNNTGSSNVHRTNIQTNINGDGC